jgi:deoxyadenosine/deoxycytidine kinase
MARFALPTQLFFLFQRARQLEALAQPDMFGRPTCRDFLLDKDPSSRASRCRATSWRSTRNLRRDPAAGPAPDLVVYLQAQPGDAYERVRRRALESSAAHARTTWRCWRKATRAFFYNYSAAPVLIVNSENLNFVAREPDLELLLARMRGMKSRREFFSLG